MTSEEMRSVSLFAGANIRLARGANHDTDCSTVPSVQSSPSHLLPILPIDRQKNRIAPPFGLRRGSSEQPPVTVLLSSHGVGRLLFGLPSLLFRLHLGLQNTLLRIDRLRMIVRMTRRSIGDYRLLGQGWIVTLGQSSALHRLAFCLLITLDHLISCRLLIANRCRFPWLVGGEVGIKRLSQQRSRSYWWQRGNLLNCVLR